MRTLVQFFHPVLEKSRVQSRLLATAETTDGVTVRDGYELYPDFDIDVEAEQAALLEHDVIIIQHPLYWYSTPALYKQWQDLVLEHGWAYGSTGTQLRGKTIFHVVSSGGGVDAYTERGTNEHSLGDFLFPHEQTARMCGMRWLPPFWVGGVHQLADEALEGSARSYGVLLEALVEDRLDLTIASGLPLLNPLVESMAASREVSDG